ncbi:Uncharacterized protein Rs2_36192 [Raphanus sativus]|nr:Uncharacterized protein Rs2_36192 [Raphanus sativus]
MAPPDTTALKLLVELEGSSSVDVTLVTLYFGYGSLLSIYGCFIYNREESYTYTILFQTCAGAVVLTDIVFWGLIYPFTKGYRLSFLHVCMHSVNAVFLLGDTCLNSLRFPLFRISYFAFWSCIFVAYQWIIHAFKNLWWPYQFLDLSSPYAPLWYLAVAGMHIPCFAVFALIIKLKNSLLERHSSL